MQPMSSILVLLRGAAPQRGSAFTEVLGDDLFNGSAATIHMDLFFDAADQFAAQKAAKVPGMVPALAKLREFARENTGIRFPHLNKNIILFQLAIRVLEPQRINQQKYGLCGPAHFAVLLARSRPDEYVELAIQFMRDGVAQHRGLRIKVQREILEHRIPKNHMPQADWVVAASLRNSIDNFPFAKNPAPDLVIGTGTEGTYAGTNSNLVCGWLKDAGYSKVVAAMNFWKPESVMESLVGVLAEDPNFQLSHPDKPDELDEFGDDLLSPQTNLRAAAKLLNHGWLLLLKVNSAWTGSNARDAASIQTLETNLSATPETAFWGTVRKPKDNHWIFVKRIDLSNPNKVQMTIYTYGEKTTTPAISLPVFLQNYGGFIAAIG
jgi:hypothetical protein